MHLLVYFDFWVVLDVFSSNELVSCFSQHLISDSYFWIILKHLFEIPRNTGVRENPILRVLSWRASSRHISYGTLTNSGNSSVKPMMAITSSDERGSSFTSTYFLFFLGRVLDVLLEGETCIWEFSNHFPSINNLFLVHPSTFQDDGFKLVK